MHFGKFCPLSQMSKPSTLIQTSHYKVWKAVMNPNFPTESETFQCGALQKKVSVDNKIQIFQCNMGYT